MDVTIDHKLRIALSELPSSLRHLIEEALSIPNMERQKMMEQHIWGWRDLPEFIKLYEYSLPSQGACHILLPRGFLTSLAKGLEYLDIDWELIDNRYSEQVYDVPSPISLHPWQEPAVQAILDSQQGIWKAPAGSGKTVGVLEAIRRSKSSALVVVNTKDILYQWRARAKTFLGQDYPVGLIGDGKFDISDYLTIATAQTLHSRFDELERSYFFDDQFSFVCLDECHHATAETYSKIVDRFTSHIRIGVSATPDKTGDFALATNVLGPIFHETRREDVSTLVTPKVFKIPTTFSFDYHSGESRGRRFNNYPELLQELISDSVRNMMIAKTIIMDSGSHALVVSKRLDHLTYIYDALHRCKYYYPILKLTGSISSQERRWITRATSGDTPCVVLSTLADEGLDIPRLDSLFLIYPQRNIGLIEQQVGRIARNHPKKSSAFVFDFADVNVGPLDAQWKVRRREVYQKHGYEIEVVSLLSILEWRNNDS